MLDAYALISVDDFESWRSGPEPGVPEFVEEIERAINAASAMIARHCRRIFRKATITDEPHDGDGSRVTQLHRPPIASVSSVKVNGATLDPAAYVVPVLASDADVEVNHNDGRLVLVAGVFPEGVRNVLVSCVGGFDPIPRSITQACLELTGHLFAARGRDVSVAIEQAEGYTADRRPAADSIPAPIRARLAPFRLPLPHGLGPQSYERTRASGW